MEPAIAQAYLDQVRRIVDAVTIAQVEALLDRNDSEGVADLLTVAAFALFLEALRSTFLAGGRFEARLLILPPLPRPAFGPAPAKIKPEFDIRAPKVEAWLQQRSAAVLEQIRQQQREAVRVTVSAGMARQQTTKQTALDIVGRVSKQTGNRTGGVIGLAEPDAATAARARDQLLSGDPKEMKKYLLRTRRDRRFDGIVNRAIEAGKPVARADVDRIVGRYADRLLVTRAEGLARTESLSTFSAGRDNVYQQLIGDVVRAENVSKTWRDRDDGKVRHTHVAMRGQKVGLDDAFQSPSGARLRFPGDRQLGAPDSEIVQCFAPWTRISVSGLKAAVTRHYVGSLVEISVGSGVNLAVTLNHPVLTQRGWVLAGEVMEGDQLVYCGKGNAEGARVNPNVGLADASAEDIYRAAESLGVVHRARGRDVNLHGEVPRHDVEVVLLPGVLADAIDAPFSQGLNHIPLADADISFGETLFQRAVGGSYRALSVRSVCPVGNDRPALALFGAGQCGASAIPLADSNGRSARLINATTHDGAADPKLLGDMQHGVAGVIERHDLRAQREPCFSGALSIEGSAACVNDVLADWAQSEVRETRANNGVRSADCGRNGPHTLPPAVQLSDLGVEGLPAVATNFDDGFHAVAVSAVVRFHYDGPVYNFETDNSLIGANGIITHNCRCSAIYKVRFD